MSDSTKPWICWCFFDSVYLTCPSHTVIKYKMYHNNLLLETLCEWSWVIFCYFILWLAKFEPKMPYILLFEIEYSHESVSKNPFFYPVVPTPTLIQLLFGSIYKKEILKTEKSTSLDVYFFDMQISRLCH